MVRPRTQFREASTLFLKGVDSTIARCQDDMRQGVLYSKNDIFREIEQGIAEDLRLFAYHILSQVPPLTVRHDILSVEEAVSAIPDMTRWPVEQAETVSMPMIPPSRMEEEAL